MPNIFFTSCNVSSICYKNDSNTLQNRNYKIKTFDY